MTKILTEDKERLWLLKHTQIMVCSLVPWQQNWLLEHTQIMVCSYGAMATELDTGTYSDNGLQFGAMETKQKEMIPTKFICS